MKIGCNERNCPKFGRCPKYNGVCLMEPKKIELATDEELLSDEQIENWRKILSLQIGPYAFMMPKEEVQLIRNKFQKMSDDFSKTGMYGTPEELYEYNAEFKNTTDNTIVDCLKSEQENKLN